MRFKAHNLKIAKELIDNIAVNTTDRNVVKAIVTMATELGLYTIAEGVEHQEQMEVLEALHCNAVQGYYTGKPVPPEIFEGLYLKK